MKSIVKYSSHELAGYGFDRSEDRVIRFNKHPDGTYLATRVSYVINNRSYTHRELRMLSFDVANWQRDNNSPRFYLIVFLVIALLLGTMLSQCSVNVYTNVQVTEDDTV